MTAQPSTFIVPGSAWCAAAVALAPLLLAACAATQAARKPTTKPAPVTLGQFQTGPAPKKMIYRTVGRRKLALYVYEPAGHKPTDRTPALVAIHGGGWGAGDAIKYFRPICRYFASRGLVAVNITYRLTSQKDVTLFDCVSDAQTAMRFVRANARKLGIDPKRIAVMGDSAGGHLAACVGLLADVAPPKRYQDVSSRADAVLAYNPIVDIPALKWAMTRPGIKTDPPAVYKPAKTPLERAQQLSPIHHVRKGLPPMLLAHGTADDCVPVEQIDRFAKAAKAAGNRCDYERVDGWKHAFVLPNYAKEETVVPALRMADAFLASLGYIRGEPPLVRKPGK